MNAPEQTFLPDGSFRHLLWVDGETLERVWRAEGLRLLVKRGKIGQEVVELLLSWRHSGFSVHAGVRVEEKASAARLGRYMARCPIVLDRLEWDAAREEVVVQSRPSRRGGPLGESERLDVLEFLRAVACRRPAPGAHWRVRGRPLQGAWPVSSITCRSCVPLSGMGDDSGLPEGLAGGASCAIECPARVVQLLPFLLVDRS